MKFLLSFVIKAVNWPSTTPTTDNKAGAAREGVISPSVVRSANALTKVVLLSQPAVHSNQCPGHPLPLLPTHVPGPQGSD